MGKSPLLAILTLIVGFCVGLLCNFGFLAPGIYAFQSTATPMATIKVPTPSTTQTAPTGTGTSPSPTATPALDVTDNAPLLDSATAVMTALKDGDYAALSRLVHPKKGLVLTPYSTVDLDANLTFTPSQISSLSTNTKKYVWGVSDGKGDPIELTMAGYFERYVYNADFANAPILGIDQVMGSGNALENVREIFPEARFVEYYFPGLNPDHKGFDWCGLKLVLEPYDNQYRLIALIHSEWTI